MKFSMNEIFATAIAASVVGNNALEASGVNQGLIDAANVREYREPTFHSLVDAWCSARNMTTRRSPCEKADLFIRAAAGGEMMAAAGFTVMNLGSIVDDAVNKVVSVKFAAVPSVIPKVCNEVDTKDYRPISNYQLTSGSFLQRLSESGELEHMRVSDSNKQYEVEDTGGILGIPRKFVVNDDMGIIKSLGDLLGKDAALTRERDFHRLVLAAIWGATNSITGPTSAFGYAALKLAHQKWADQESDGAPISVGGSVLLLQSGAMELDGRNIQQAERLRDRSDQTIDQADANVFHGAFTDVIGTPWFRHASMLAAKTATAWIEFSDPKVHSMFEVGYLGGPDGEGRIPKVETAQMPFTSLGVQMRVLFTYGMGQVSDVGAVFAVGE